MLHGDKALSSHLDEYLEVERVWAHSTPLILIVSTMEKGKGTVFCSFEPNTPCHRKMHATVLVHLPSLTPFIIAFLSIMPLLNPTSAFIPPPISFPNPPSSALGFSKTMPMNAPLESKPSHSLYSLIADNRNQNEKKAVPIAGIHDALSAKIFARRRAPALFLSGFGVSASLLGVPDAGITTLVEMEQITRNVCSAVRNQSDSKSPPLIVDGDTGYGGPSNMLRTISCLASAGAAAVTIEDQDFPKKCTIAAGDKIRIVGRTEAVERVRGALGARDLSESPHANASAGCWIVARTDCRLAYGFDEVLERCLRFEELGAEIVYAENLQSVDEYEKLRARLDPCTVTMVAQVEKQRDGKPLLSARQIGELGYDLALFGVSPLQCVISALMSSADQFYDNDGIIANDPKSLFMSDFDVVKQVVGFNDIEDFERKFPCG